MKKELYILNEAYKMICDDALFIGEDDNGTTYNVYIPVDSIKSYLGTEVDICLGGDLTDTAQAIYEAWATRPTSYDLQVIKQKQTGWSFGKKKGGIDTIETNFSNPKEFMTQNGYVTFTPYYS